MGGHPQKKRLRSANVFDRNSGMNTKHCAVRRIIGWSLLLAPYIALAVFVTIGTSWQFTAAVFGLAGLLIGMIALGVRLTD